MTKISKDRLQTAARLKEIRLLEAVTQSDFAKQVGHAQSVYSKIERGELNISPKIFHFLCKKKGYSYDWITSGSGEMKAFPDLQQQVANLSKEVIALKSTLEKLLKKIR